MLAIIHSSKIRFIIANIEGVSLGIPNELAMFHLYAIVLPGPNHGPSSWSFTSCKPHIEHSNYAMMHNGLSPAKT